MGSNVCDKNERVLHVGLVHGWSLNPASPHSVCCVPVSLRMNYHRLRHMLSGRRHTLYLTCKGKMTIIWLNINFSLFEICSIGRMTYLLFDISWIMTAYCIIFSTETSSGCSSCSCNAQHPLCHQWGRFCLLYWHLSEGTRWTTS